MKITLTNTTKIVELNGVPARVWEGATESGIPVFAFITRVGVNASEDCSEFERQLQECTPPSADLGPIPARLIL